jgi:hypothetical protein
MSQNSAKCFAKANWAFVPGPPNDSVPLSSVDVHQLVAYSPQEIAATILAFPGMRLLNNHQPTWWDWKAGWDNESEFVELNMTLMGRSNELWGGSEINALCMPESLVAIWKHLKANHPGVWLHDADCQMHTEKSFLESFISN